MYMLYQVVAVQGYQPVKAGKKEGATGDREEKEAGGATDSPEEGGEAEREVREEDEDKKEASRKAEEACLEGLSDEIQDMLVVCAVVYVMCCVGSMYIYTRPSHRT